MESNFLRHVAVLGDSWIHMNSLSTLIREPFQIQVSIKIFNSDILITLVNQIQ